MKPFELPIELIGLPTELTPLLRKKKISVKAAARLNDISEDTFRRRFGHLIVQVSKRRQAVELGNAVDLPPPPPSD